MVFLLVLGEVCDHASEAVRLLGDGDCVKGWFIGRDPDTQEVFHLV
jgi:hypothetical protein